MTTSPLICAAAEIALNRYLRLESAVVEDCGRLSGRTIELALSRPPLSLVIEFMAGGVRVLPALERESDVRVRGTPTQIASLLRRVAAGDAGMPGQIDVEGDAELLQRFRRMLVQVGFDPEEWLAPFVGGPAAHRLVSGLQRVFNWGRDSGEKLALNTAEYLREETYDLARKRDVEEWAGDVDDIRESVDRLEARLRLLEERAAPKPKQRKAG
jgi:ubiquinone biosynthesis protein UbiJ